ncbi:MFS transporter [Brevibacterium sp.]|uniref:MFS transporter n=1 Tax=Brevibacterium sp. TaxID=1701 RepID=UPI002811BBCE|nr:MFS transporter [Brevibacterium sp.]
MTEITRRGRMDRGHRRGVRSDRDIDAESAPASRYPSEGSRPVMPQAAARAAAGTARLPLLIYVLAIGVFLMGTTEFIVAGILPEIATDLGVGVADAGLMITVFAIGMIIGTPLMAIATLKLQRRLALSLALVVFAIGHVVVALTSSFPLILGMRFVTALATGAFWAVSAVVAAKAVGPRLSSKALGIVLGGGMLANVIGVPLGAFAGQAIGWRGPFWALALLALIAVLPILKQVPVDPAEGPVPSVHAEIAGLRDLRIWLVLGGAAIVCGSSLAAYSFISPLLTENTGMAASTVPLVLLAYGLGALIGSNLGGALGTHRPYGVLFTAAAVTLLVLVGLALFSHSVFATVALVFLLGLFGMATNPILIGKAVGYADEAPTLASALATSAFNVGTAVGSWVAGFALESALGATGPVVVGAAIAALYFLPLSALVVKDRRAERRILKDTRPDGEPIVVEA